jgi:ribosomal protein S18 acetylase RimI-like enzyme
MNSQKMAVALILSQIKYAATVLARAFYEDPFFTFTLPDAGKRARLLPWLFSKIISYGYSYGKVYTTPSLEGVAIWLGPQNTTLAMTGILRTGMFLLPVKFNWQEFQRNTRLANYADQLHKKSITGRHWYLLELGTEPALQGQGIGRALLEPVLAQADQDGLICYLDTYNEKSIFFYERNGFSVTNHGQASPESPPIWAMQRKPI